MKLIALGVLAACGGGKPDPIVEDLTCPAVVEHVAKLTRRSIDYARPVVEEKLSETDPRYMRQLRIDQAIAKACGSRDLGSYGPCARTLVVDAMAKECVDREWSEDRRRCLLTAQNQAAIDACGPSPAPILEAAPPTQAPTPTRSLGEDCIADEDCPAPAKCVVWTTEGGDRSSTCEIPCGPKPDYKCPPGRGCVHQGGGPNEVCLERK